MNRKIQPGPAHRRSAQRTTFGARIGGFLPAGYGEVPPGLWVALGVATLAVLFPLAIHLGQSGGGEDDFSSTNSGTRSDPNPATSPWTSPPPSANGQLILTPSPGPDPGVAGVLPAPIETAEPSLLPTPAAEPSPWLTAEPSPSPTPVVVSPSPSPAETSPSPTPVVVSPSPTPAVPSPSPTAVPSPSPTPAVPSPSPTPAVPSPSPTAVPSPSPTPVPRLPQTSDVPHPAIPEAA